MNIAFHQPHYFPWLGYFDKMAKVDEFILMDEVQLEDKSRMVRNKFLNKDGELVYLSIPCEKKGHMDREYREIRLIEGNKWQKKHYNFFQNTYKYSPYYKEIMHSILPIFEKDYTYVSEVTIDSVIICKDLLGITTKIKMMSDLVYDRNKIRNLNSPDKKSQKILEMCLSEKATGYMTGTGGSLGFLDKENFEQNGVMFAIQSFEQPLYEQRFSDVFIEGLSILDMLFNIGIDNVRTKFWNGVESKNEFTLRTGHNSVIE